MGRILVAFAISVMLFTAGYDYSTRRDACDDELLHCYDKWATGEVT